MKPTTGKPNLHPPTIRFETARAIRQLRRDRNRRRFYETAFKYNAAIVHDAIELVCGVYTPKAIDLIDRLSIKACRKVLLKIGATKS